MAGSRLQRECQRQAADFAGPLSGMPSGREDDSEPPRTGSSLYPAVATGATDLGFDLAPAMPTRFLGLAPDRGAMETW